MPKLSKISFLIPVFLFVILDILIWNIGTNTPRTDFVLFISQYLIAFCAFYALWINKWNISYRGFLLMAIVLRLVLLFTSPELSNDFYRYSRYSS